MTVKQWLLLITTAGCWALIHPLIEVLLVTMTPVVLVTSRVMFSAVVLCLYFTVTGKLRMPAIQTIILCLPHALLGMVLPFLCITYAQTHITASAASILNTSIAFWAMILGAKLLHDEPLNFWRLFGLCLGIIGVAITMGGTQDSQWLYAILVIIAGAIYALATIYAKTFLKNLDASQITCAMMIISTLLLLNYIIATGEPIPNTMTTMNWVYVAALVLLCTILPFVIFFHLLPQIGAGNVSLVNIITPPLTVLLDLLWLQQMITLYQLLGMVIIMIGLALINQQKLYRALR